jgi:hypothetical protein
MSEPVEPPIEDEPGKSALSSLFGDGSIGQQFLLWNIGSVIASAILAPVLTNITNAVYPLDPSAPLAPGDLAGLVARGLITQGDGRSKAANSGVSNSNFDSLVDAALGPLDLGSLLEALRRGLISDGVDPADSGSFGAAMQDLGVRPEYWPTIAALRIQIPSIAEVMNAWLEGQIEESEALQRYTLAGGDPTWFQTSYNANGEAPTPDMLQVMLNRGIIPEDGTGPESISFQQGFLEGPWRNKWLTPMLALRVYLPPPRTVTALQHEGAITAATALDLYEKEGLSQELATAYVNAATHTKLATSKALTKSEIITLYKDLLITPGEATSMLETLGYEAPEAAEELAMADFQREAKLLTATVSKIHSLYVGHKITKTAATNDLHQAGVPADQVQEIFTEWDLQLVASVGQLTASQIANGFGYGALTQSEAIAELNKLGYSDFDGWVLLSIANLGAIPGKPPMNGPVGGVNV